LSGFDACLGADVKGVMKTTPPGLPLPTFDIVWEGFDHRVGMSGFFDRDWSQMAYVSYCASPDAFQAELFSLENLKNSRHVRSTDRK
jgi:hypothetical protein